MNDALKQSLLGQGLTEDQIAKLEAQGVKEPADMAYYTVDSLMADTGCGRIIAAKIMAVYAPAPSPVSADPVPATAAQPAAPMNITVRTGNPEDMTIQELLTLVAGGERSQDTTSVLRRKVGAKRRVYVRIPGEDRLDVAETMDMINQDFPEGEEPQFWGSQPTETLSEILEIRKYADPLNGRALAKGDPWLKLNEEQRAAFIYARMKGSDLLTGSEDKYALVAEAQSDPAGERWVKIQTLWTRGIKGNDPLIMEARAATIYSVSRGTTRRADDPMRDRRRSSAFVGGSSGADAGFRDES